MGRKTLLSASVCVLMLIWVFPAWAAPASPTNDDFRRAKRIQQLNATLVANITSATLEEGEPQPCGIGDNTVWYRYTTPATTGVRFDTSKSDFDTVISIFTGDALNNLEHLGCSFDPETFGPSRVLDIGLQEGIAYSIQVGGWEDAVGQLKLDITPQPLPSNDAFSNAAAVDPLPFHAEQDTDFATLQAGELSEPCAPIGSTVWYTFTSESGGDLTVQTLGSDFDTVIAVYEGGAFSDSDLVACDDDGGEQLDSKLQFSARPGVVYNIQAGGYDDDRGHLVFRVAQGADQEDCTNVGAGTGDVLVEACVAIDDEGSPSGHVTVDLGFLGLSCTIEGSGSGHCESV